MYEKHCFDYLETGRHSYIVTWQISSFWAHIMATCPPHCEKVPSQVHKHHVGVMAVKPGQKSSTRVTSMQNMLSDITLTTQLWSCRQKVGNKNPWKLLLFRSNRYFWSCCANTRNSRIYANTSESLYIYNFIFFWKTSAQNLIPENLHFRSGQLWHISTILDVRLYMCT